MIIFSFALKIFVLFAVYVHFDYAQQTQDYFQSTPDVILSEMSEANEVEGSRLERQKIRIPNKFYLSANSQEVSVSLLRHYCKCGNSELFLKIPGSQIKLGMTCWILH